jgi:hypothetical protein
MATEFNDLVPLTEIARRLELHPKTVKRLHRGEGLPLIRLTDGGPYYGFWSSVQAWARKRGDIVKT